MLWLSRFESGGYPARNLRNPASGYAIKLPGRKSPIFEVQTAPPTAKPKLEKVGGFAPPTFSSWFCGRTGLFRPPKTDDFRPGSCIA